MRTIDRRLDKLEHRFGIAHTAPRYLLLLMNAGRELGPAEDAYIKSLDESGSLPTGGFAVIDLSYVQGRGALNRDRTRIASAPEITVELL